MKMIRRTIPAGLGVLLRAVALMVVVVWLPGCGIAGLGDERFVAHIEMLEEGKWPVDVPDTVDVAVPFTVRLTSAGGACPSRGETETRLTENVAVITPYRFRSGGTCIALIVYTEHEATLQFDRRGDARVVVQARRGGESLVLDYPVWVR